MKEFDLAVFLVVFQEMLGPLLWILPALAIAGLVSFAAVLLHEGGLVSRRLVRSEIVGVLGGFAALGLMAMVTISGFSDAGGPVDWLLVGLIWGVGLVGATILAYAVQGVFAWKAPHGH
ncbi:hypothetical protein FZ983_17510 [Azospirillum sp. B21]|uniref:DUF5368 domain-containing protein n=1 Tax=Azospirillum sp. B21 TaxID=2607496 RepID=UPI0011EC2215|nr:DUF5368 domain-containing protein [Azospirillum sp. B21]KAA0579115.1 hypothetical protein FZ983_17510 [Azospirillum sp. B21]